MTAILPFRRRSRFRGPRRFLGFLLLAVLIAAGGRYVEQLRRDGSMPEPGSHATGQVRHGSNIGTDAALRRPRVLRSRNARAIDGDSLRVGSERIRLDGIDAPELRQTCRDSDGREWPCGRAARVRLAEFVSGRDVACTARGHDLYGRTLAICSAGDFRDLGAALVRVGLAVNYDRYTQRYRTTQEQARAVRRGIWSGSFEPPEEWRASHRPVSVGLR